MERIQSKLFKMMAHLVGRKRFWMKTGESLQRGIVKRRSLKHEPPKKIHRLCKVEEKVWNSYSYYMLHPYEQNNNQCVLYLHGGGYVNKITSFHWRFIMRLMQSLQCTVIVPLYPLAPENTVKQTMEFVQSLYMTVLDQMDTSTKYVLMGDSAGGGLALSFSQFLREKGLKQPHEIVLISPWLDVSLTNPHIKTIERHDSFLAIPGLLEAGKMYAGEAALTHYLVSPLYGSLHTLGKITMFMGTHDILVADARRLVASAAEEGVAIDYHEYPYMMHDFPLFSFEESKHAFEIIRKTIQKITPIV